MLNFDDLFWLYSRCVKCGDTNFHQVMLNTQGRIVVGCPRCSQLYKWREVSNEPKQKKKIS